MPRRDRVVIRSLTAAVTALLAAAVAGVVALVTGASVPVARSAAQAAVAAPRPPAPVAAPPSTEPPPAAPVPQPGYIATLGAPTPYHARPGGPVQGVLPARNPFGGAEIVAVTASQETGGVTWLDVELPVRPNGSTAWLPAAGVSLTRTSYRVLVSLTARTLTVTDAGRAVLTTPVAVGAAATPTPPGNTYLWELVRPYDPAGAYGPYIFGLAEYSDSYSQFNGGEAQIGIHGQDESWSIGQAASHGCVRLPNDVVTRLAGMLPLGTPVTIG